MPADSKTMARVLESVPQQKPFRFIDEIIELGEDHIVGSYRFRDDEYFYRGHFPGKPITPGVILIETMAQTGVVAFGLYLNLLQRGKGPGEPDNLITLFTMCDAVEFTGLVSPGERVIIHSEKIYFRNKSIKTKVRMERENGEIVCSGILAGMGVVIS